MAQINANKISSKLMEKLKRFLKDNLVVGLIFFGPVFGTVYVLIIIFRFLDGILSGIYDQILGVHIPGLGFISLVFLILITGVFARTYLANFAIQIFENVILRIPVAKSIYSTLKNITEVMQSSNGRLGKPTAIKLSNGYIPGIELSTDRDYSVFLLPSTPNPTTGFILIIPRKHVLQLDNVSMDDFMKFMVSVGIYSKPLIQSLRNLESSEEKREGKLS